MTHPLTPTQQETRVNEQPCGNYIPNGDNDACECGHSMYSHDLSKSDYIAGLRIREHARRLEESRQRLIAEAEASGEDKARRAYMLQGAAMVGATQASMAIAGVFREALKREAPAPLPAGTPIRWYHRLWWRVKRWGT